jgi:branched-chain amino acid transport system substrate-binding protein
MEQAGEAGVGQRGVSRQAWTNDASGASFAQAYKELTHAQPGPYDGAAYDAMAVALLAAVKAAIALPDPATVTPADVKQAMTRLNVKSGQVIRTGVDEFKKAVAAIAAGIDIDYEGASGPVDFDNGEVKANIALYEIQKVGGELQFVETQVYDCISDPSCPVKT